MLFSDLEALEKPKYVELQNWEEHKEYLTHLNGVQVYSKKAAIYPAAIRIGRSTYSAEVYKDAPYVKFSSLVFDNDDLIFEL